MKRHAEKCGPRADTRRSGDYDAKTNHESYYDMQCAPTPRSAMTLNALCGSWLAWLPGVCLGPFFLPLAGPASPGLARGSSVTRFRRRPDSNARAAPPGSERCRAQRTGLPGELVHCAGGRFPAGSALAPMILSHGDAFVLLRTPRCDRAWFGSWSRRAASPPLLRYQHMVGAADEKAALPAGPPPRIRNRRADRQPEISAGRGACLEPLRKPPDRCLPRPLSGVRI